MKKRSRQIDLPDLTSLIDVVFLLLIFFMVSTVFKKNNLALSLSLPKVSKNSQQKHKKERKNLTIEINQDTLAYNGANTTIEKLTSTLKTIVDKTKGIELHIDKAVPYQKIVSILDLLQKNSLSNISLITTESTAK